ncbi:MAG: hypothetical protein A2W00_12035 [Candidatus Eisenbacteria bacterium RBG_16_71_46]|nr:MAG: hypothetical protein A2W00_12035 [Candidatus Eisenbacteria bacterium RBG_16_71_46]
MTTARTIIEDRTLLAERLADARSRTDELFDLLAPGALHERPIPERHRLIFYLGHVEAFDWNLIPRGALGRPSFDSAFDQLFAFGIDPVDGGLPNEPASDWPPVEKVREYNRRAREAVDRALDHAGEAAPELRDGTLIQVAIEHRLMHAETLAYLLHQLPTNHKRPPALVAPPPPRALKRRMVRIPAGRAALGLGRDTAFGWDNEFDEHVVEVPSFQIDLTQVTNGGFLEFLRAGGYENRRWWADDDWAWQSRRPSQNPHDWLRRSDGWYLRGMFHETQLPLDAPVVVSLAEARAYARWAGKRLPTEAEFHRAAYGTPDGHERAYPWGEDEPEARHGNFDFHGWDPAPVGSFPAGDSAFGIADLVGNGWEWTATTFGPFDGFVPFPFYAGYSANFFDGQHFVMKGGSPRTAACMLRRSFRNWFQPHYPYACTTFRLVTR